MNLPIQSASVIRPGNCMTDYHGNQILSSQQLIGACIDNRGWLIGHNFNQSACCALRVAKDGGFWLNPLTGVPVYC